MSNIERYFKAEEPVCHVKVDGSDIASGDFVAVLSKDNGDAALLYNTDCVTLGLAIKLIASAFIENFAKLSDEERDLTKEALGSAFNDTLMNPYEHSV